tara:strand:- start:51 stop:194 length:144 start_codon:yes stop_codon:yes gene_type:complete
MATNMATFKNELTALQADSHGYMVATLVFFDALKPVFNGVSGEIGIP